MTIFQIRGGITGLGDAAFSLGKKRLAKMGFADGNA
jgi:hypothetical protein